MFSGEQVTVCQDEDFSISCLRGLVIVPRQTFYGRRDVNVCQQLWGNNDDTSCSHHDAMEQITILCFNKASCQIKASDAHIFFENPCLNVPKYLEVEYTCTKRKYTLRPKYLVNAT